MARWIADLMLIGVVSFVGYVILIAIEKKQIANLVLTVAVMMGLLVTLQDLTPVIQRWNARIDSLQNTVDKVGSIGQGEWTFPMKGKITQIYKGEAHHGIDIGAPEGTPVGATRKGQVARVEWSDIYGNMVVVDHGDGMESVYGHLSGISVKTGYPVIAGTRIGTCGSTGRSSGPHLHFEIRKNSTCVDPLPYLN